MLAPEDLGKIDDCLSSIQELIDEVVEHYSKLTQPQQELITRIVLALDRSWEKLLADVGESNAAVPEKSMRALLACGCVMACMEVIQADDQITLAEMEVLLHLTSRFSEPLSLSGVSPVSEGTTSGTMEFYSHLVDTYDIMDYRIAGSLCAAIDSFRNTRLMAKFARFVTVLGTQISFVDGEEANQRELRVLNEFDDTMRRVSEAINDATL